MNKKAMIAIVLVAVIFIGAGVGFAVHQGKKPEATTVTVSAVTESTSGQASTSQTESTAAPTSATTATTATSESASAEDLTKYDYIREGAWYIYNDSAKSAIAFTFTDEDDVNIAYFDESNVMGEDAKFFQGEADYTIADGKIIIEDIPKTVGAETIVLEPDGKGIKHGDIALEHYGDVSLQYPYDHFNA